MELLATVLAFGFGLHCLIMLTIAIVGFVISLFNRG